MLKVILDQTFRTARRTSLSTPTGSLFLEWEHRALIFASSVLQYCSSCKLETWTGSQYSINLESSNLLSDAVSCENIMSCFPWQISYSLIRLRPWDEQRKSAFSSSHVALSTSRPCHITSHSHWQSNLSPASRICSPPCSLEKNNDLFFNKHWGFVHSEFHLKPWMKK